MQALAMQEPIISEGTLRTPEGRVLPLEHTAVQARVVGPVATVEVAQRFRNDTGGAIEAVYLRSASMRGESLVQARRAVLGILRTTI